MQYRRAQTPGATYFFTVVTYQRQKIFQDANAVSILRGAFREVKAVMPFEIEAIILLPEHLHCIWTLPEGDADFSVRWRLIKGAPRKRLSSLEWWGIRNINEPFAEFYQFTISLKRLEVLNLGALLALVC